ncbi:XRE family transcriptional regulator [Geobacillus subterraneus]|uniref:XRE family transcriptional regulator n=2 Tax=Geobacillus TaxID=129337 RepID=A0ABN4NHK9_9BACL|nr:MULTISPECIES: helix-turn-helix transcriptional regulator [Geobacillus]AMX82266.1 XRE family transcriptional regulator [Geobacillus subterraneus]KZS26446.1 transcriptional regulator [Geobacillus subterraneus]OQP04644.1 transcriptional regulator [Geobacillus sp. 46C-IIa]OXB91306.1 transcriptional regulator [Geobacillus uzenensis]QIZ65942.1 helix-turn-helix transcriptional regulator [Geobacillus subterraneus]
MKNLGEMLKRLRKQQRWTQEQLAEQLNVSRSQISKWENGSLLPDIQSLEKLCRLFHVSADFLIGSEVQRQEVLREVKRLYGTTEINEKTLAAIDYLLQNQDMSEAMYTLTKLPEKKRKHVETMLMTIIKECAEAIG